MVRTAVLFHHPTCLALIRHGPPPILPSGTRLTAPLTLLLQLVTPVASSCRSRRPSHHRAHRITAFSASFLAPPASSALDHSSSAALRRTILVNYATLLPVEHEHTPLFPRPRQPICNQISAAEYDSSPLLVCPRQSLEFVFRSSASTRQHSWAFTAQL
ncbi:hypothetical protein B0H11DRAFT_2252956 [Mycena galericulata]|nr:hypothetical protein B0H11DRAFT_2252956 [Mycena galericulata]